MLNLKSVVIISQGSKYTGVNKYAINTYQAVKSNAQIFFIKFRKNHYGNDVGEAIEGKFFYGDSILNFNSLFPKIGFSKFIGYLKKLKSDGALIHVASQHVLPISPGFNNVVTIHDIAPFLNYEFHSYKSKLEYLFNKMIYKHYLKYSSILTDSDYVRKIIEEMGPNGKVTRIYPYVSDNFNPLKGRMEIRKKYSLPLDKKLILSVSTITPRKNLKILKEVFSSLGNEYKLVRVGGKIFNSYSCSPVDEKGMNELYNACDTFLSVSLDEGFGYPVVEAAKSGISLAVSEIPVHREILNGYGTYFDPLSSSSIAMGIREATEQDVTNYNQLSKILYRYSFTEFQKQIIDYYERKDIFD